MADSSINIYSDRSEHAPSSSRPRRPPPITPKRFTRFFTPRTSTRKVTEISISKSGRQLRDITQEALNRRHDSQQRLTQRKSMLFADVPQDEMVQKTPSTSSSRKRKALPSPISSPIQSSPCKRVRFPAHIDVPSSPPPLAFEDEVEDDGPVRRVLDEISRPVPLRRASTFNVTARILQRSFGGFDSVTRGRRKDNCICKPLLVPLSSCGTDDSRLGSSNRGLLF